MLWNHLIIYENDYHVWWSLHLTERSTYVEKPKRGRLNEDRRQREIIRIFYFYYPSKILLNICIKIIRRNSRVDRNGLKIIS